MSFLGSNRCLDRLALLVCGVFAAFAAYYFLHVSGEHAILVILSLVVVSGHFKEKELQKEVDALKEKIKQRS